MQYFEYLQVDRSRDSEKGREDGGHSVIVGRIQVGPRLIQTYIYSTYAHENNLSLSIRSLP